MFGDDMRDLAGGMVIFTGFAISVPSERFNIQYFGLLQ